MNSNTAETKPWTRKHIISLEDFTTDEYDAVLTIIKEDLYTSNCLNFKNKK